MGLGGKAGEGELINTFQGGKLNSVWTPKELKRRSYLFVKAHVTSSGLSVMKPGLFPLG